MNHRGLAELEAASMRARSGGASELSFTVPFPSSLLLAPLQKRAFLPPGTGCFLAAGV